jgi:hypothetical protein
MLDVAVVFGVGEHVMHVMFWGPPADAEAAEKTCETLNYTKCTVPRSVTVGCRL